MTLVNLDLNLDVTDEAAGRVDLVFDSTEQQALILANSLEAVVGIADIALDLA
ncbi:hypothetical protein HQO83_17475 [Rhodococcus fascians]|nr:hypothetical protein [Rhodococcus fascians]